MERQVEVRRALISDAKTLTGISKRAFDSDVCCGNSGLGGPPGYDSDSWQKKVIEAIDYDKILLNEKIIGGVIVRDEGSGSFNLMRIFIDPDYHRNGYGLQSMHDTLEKYPNAKRWWLDTPAWNTRTCPFYLKLGFEIKEEKDGSLIFEKLV
ncbi:GNAT family N-acetyltransferase [bacterium]|nr:GNAT family N-acetyltransferase [bacterium]